MPPAHIILLPLLSQLSNPYWLHQTTTVATTSSAVNRRRRAHRRWPPQLRITTPDASKTTSLTFSIPAPSARDRSAKTAISSCTGKIRLRFCEIADLSSSIGFYTEILNDFAEGTRRFVARSADRNRLRWMRRWRRNGNGLLLLLRRRDRALWDRPRTPPRNPTPQKLYARELWLWLEKKKFAANKYIYIVFEKKLLIIPRRIRKKWSLICTRERWVQMKSVPTILIFLFIYSIFSFFLFLGNMASDCVYGGERIESPLFGCHEI